VKLKSALKQPPQTTQMPLPIYLHAPRSQTPSPIFLDSPHKHTTHNTTMTKAPTENEAAKHRNERTYRSPLVSFPPAIGKVLAQFSSKIGSVRRAHRWLVVPAQGFSAQDADTSIVALNSGGTIQSSQVLTPQSCKEQGARIKKEGGMPRMIFRSLPVPPDVAPVGQCAGSTRLYSTRSQTSSCACVLREKAQSSA
jgi:hypothetical protein